MMNKCCCVYITSQYIWASHLILPNSSNKPIKSYITYILHLSCRDSCENPWVMMWNMHISDQNTYISLQPVCNYFPMTVLRVKGCGLWSWNKTHPAVFIVSLHFKQHVHLTTKLCDRFTALLMLSVHVWSCCTCPLCTIDQVPVKLVTKA